MAQALAGTCREIQGGEYMSSRKDAFYTLITHLQKIEDGTSVFCVNCPIAGTEYCHKLNPKAKRYTRAEKEKIRHEMDERNKEAK